MNASHVEAAAGKQPPVGIDLGTTYSVVAYLEASGRPATIVNSAGDLLTPSAVFFEEGEVIVGKEAIKGSQISPEAFADCFKRDIGRGSFRRPIRGAQVPPEVLDGFLLARLKEDAQRRLGPVRQVVITVPAFFDETRRQATQDAGRLAGLEVLDIINEPTAAAVAFGYHRRLLEPTPRDTGTPERILVYDLGGGTFDVTILEIQGNTFRTLATDGDVQLGGKDFDERLVNSLAERFLAEHGVDPRSVPADALQLWIDAQEAKHALSERKKVTMVSFHAGLRLRQEISRAEFEAMTHDLLERTETTTELVLKQAGLSWPEVNRVLLVGGSTRMPMVIDLLRRLSGQEPDRSLSPDEVVAHGAALYAGLLMEQSGGNSAPRFRLVNVNAHSLGVVGTDAKTQERVNVVLIPKNTPLPCRRVRRFRTALANQRSVRVPIVEGESRLPEHCIALGQCVIRDLPSGLPQGAQIEVEYRYASNGRISVVARVPAVRQSARWRSSAIGNMPWRTWNAGGNGSAASRRWSRRLLWKRATSALCGSGWTRPMWRQAGRRWRWCCPRPWSAAGRRPRRPTPPSKPPLTPGTRLTPPDKPPSGSRRRCRPRRPSPGRTSPCKRRGPRAASHCWP